jgi:hypothetical protein
MYLDLQAQSQSGFTEHAGGSSGRRRSSNAAAGSSRLKSTASRPKPVKRSRGVGDGGKRDDDEDDEDDDSDGDKDEWDRRKSGHLRIQILEDLIVDKTDVSDVEWVPANMDWEAIENRSEADTIALQYQCDVDSIWCKYKYQLARPDGLPREARISGARLRLDPHSVMLSGDDRCTQCCQTRRLRKDGDLRIRCRLCGLYRLR